MADIWLTQGDKLLAALRAGRVGVWRWRIGTEKVEWTDNLEDIHRVPPGSFDGSFSFFGRDVDENDDRAVWDAISAALETGNPYHVIYRSRSSGEPLWIEARGMIVADQEGGRFLTGVCQDVTAMVVARDELARRLRQQEGIEKLGSFALGEVGFEAVLDEAVAIAADVLDAPLAKIMELCDNGGAMRLVAGRGWRDGLVGTAIVDIDAGSQAGYALAAGAPVVVGDLAAETRFAPPSLLLDHKARSGVSAIIMGDAGRAYGVIGVHDKRVRRFDQSDVNFLAALANILSATVRQRESLRRQKLLVREMAHRSGNLLQVVASVATQTLRSHDDREEALAVFHSRLDALSRANMLVAGGGWSSTRLKQLARESVAPFGDRFVFEGRDIVVSADLAFDIALVLHELATNSVKYGTLARDQGQLQIRWEMREGKDGRQLLWLEWTDPAPLGNWNAGRGFGFRLKRGIIEDKWGGRMRIETDGRYRFSFEVPVA